MSAMPIVSMTLPEYARYECRIDARRVRLTRTETEMLALLLVSDPDAYIPHQALLTALWSIPHLKIREASYARQYVHHLRRKGVPIETRFPAPGKGQRDRNGYRIGRDSRGAAANATTAQSQSPPV